MSTHRNTDPSHERLRQLGHDLRVPVVGEELGPTLCAGGFDEALPRVVEVFEREHEGRHQRRVDRLRRASQLPPGKTFGTFKHERLPHPL